MICTEGQCHTPRVPTPGRLEQGPPHPYGETWRPAKTKTAKSDGKPLKVISIMPLQWHVLNGHYTKEHASLQMLLFLLLLVMEHSSRSLLPLTLLTPGPLSALGVLCWPGTST